MPAAETVNVLTPPSNLDVTAHGGPGSATHPERAIAIVALHKQGLSVQRIADDLRADRRTVQAILDRYVGDAAAEAKLMLSSRAIEFAADWITASAKAAKSGNHNPAKDALLLTRAIEPLPPQTASVNVGIQVVLGTPDLPCGYAPHSLTIEHTSPDQTSPDTSSPSIGIGASADQHREADLHALTAPTPGQPPGATALPELPNALQPSALQATQQDSAASTPTHNPDVGRPTIAQPTDT